jgi:ABC-type arginine/histidine transport system permease subunit
MITSTTNDLIFTITVDDVQKVAKDLIKRELTEQELFGIKDIVMIDWQTEIEYSIMSVAR